MIMSLFSATAVAQAPSAAGDILWLVEGSSSTETEQVLAGIEEALSAEREGHLLGYQDLHGRVSEGSRSFPRCTSGAESCGAAEAIAFDALGLGLLIRLTVERSGDNIEINYEMVDRRGEVASSGRVEEVGARQAGFELVRELFDAVGVVSFESDPAGATVRVDGEAVGQAPLSRQFGVGNYDYQIDHDGYESTRGSVEVRTGEAHRVDVQLAVLPGGLRVRGAPEGATVWIDGEPHGRSSEVIEVEAGHRAVEVRAEGFESDRRSVEIEPAQTTEIEVQMATMSPLLREMAASDLADHRFQFDVGLEFGGQMSNFRNARGTVDDEEFSFQGWLDGGELLEDGRGRLLMLPAGLRFGFSWEGDQLGLGLLSVSMVGHSMEQRLRLNATADGGEVDALLMRARSFQLRPMQVRYRFFYENLAPFAQAGLGVAFQWMDVRVDDREVRLRQTDAFGALELGVRYHFDPRWSAGGSYRIQNYFGTEMGVEHMLGVSIGVGLRDLPGMEPRPPEEL